MRPFVVFNCAIAIFLARNLGRTQIASPGERNENYFWQANGKEGKKHLSFASERERGFGVCVVGEMNAGGSESVVLEHSLWA